MKKEAKTTLSRFPLKAAAAAAAVIMALSLSGAAVDPACAKAKFKRDAVFASENSKPSLLRSDDELKSEAADPKWGDAEKEITPKNYKDMLRSPIGRKRKKVLIERTFDSPKTKFFKSDFTVNGEIVWTGMYKRINRLDDNFTPFAHYTDFNFWVDSKSEGPRKEQFFCKIGALSLNEESFDARKVFLDDTYAKIKLGAVDLKLGNCIETLGSGDNISFIDNLNPKRFHKGLAGDYNRSKKAVPMVKANVYLNKNMNFEFHVLPFFEKSDLADVKSVWATGFQKTLAAMTLQGLKIVEEETSGKTKFTQYHIGFNNSFENFEFRAHYQELRETLPFVTLSAPATATLEYPKYRVLGVDGNVGLGGEYLLRYELARFFGRRYTAYDEFVIGAPFTSDSWAGLLGIDRTFSNSLYVNLQGVFTSVENLVAPTAAQKFSSESGVALRVQKGYQKDKYQTEFQGFFNQRTREYLLKFNVEYRYSDMVKYVLGKHVNDGPKSRQGAISEFRDNNHTYLQVKINW